MSGQLLDHSLRSLVPEEPGSASTVELRQRIGRLTGRAPPTLRTVQRRLDALSYQLPDLQRTDGKPYRWSWRAGAKQQNQARLNPESALMYSLLRRHLQPLVPPVFAPDLAAVFQQADALLENVHQRHLKRWESRTAIASSGFRLGLPVVDESVLVAVQQGLFERLMLKLRYHSLSLGEAREMVVHPQGLLLVDGAFYLVATVEGWGDLRQFALHRVESVVRLEGSSRDVPGFSADDYVNEQQALQFPQARKIRLQLRVRDFLASHLRERRLAPDQVMANADNEWCTVTATVQESLQLEWWLRWFGDQVEVVKPVSLRNRMRANAAAINALYGKTRRRNE